MSIGRRKYSSGVVTLTVSIMLLIVGGFMFFKTANATFYQSKRFQNELIAKKAQWIAEGGLECAFTINKTNPSLQPTMQDYTGCTAAVVGTGEDKELYSILIAPSLITGTTNTYKLSSQASEDNGTGRRAVVKEIEVETTAAMASVLKTSANLNLIGDIELVPNPGQQKGSFFECISMVLKNRSNLTHTQEGSGNAGKLVVKDSDGFTDNKNVTHGSDPSLTFSCLSGYQTYNQTDWAEPQFAGDILEDSQMDMFQDLFGKPKEKWKEVRDNEFNGAIGITINADTEGTMVEDCFERVVQAYADGKRKIWVDGSCYLKKPIDHTGSDNPFNLSTPLTPVDGVKMVLVIRDGVFFSPEAQLGFNGLLYQFKSGNRTDAEIQADMAAACVKAIRCNDTVYNAWLNGTAIYAEGSFGIHGGLAIDMPEFNFNLRGSYLPIYNPDKWEGLIPSSTTNIQWKKGSWRDF